MNVPTGAFQGSLSFFSSLCLYHANIEWELLWTRRRRSAAYRASLIVMALSCSFRIPFPVHIYTRLTVRNCVHTFTRYMVKYLDTKVKLPTKCVFCVLHLHASFILHPTTCQPTTYFRFSSTRMVRARSIDRTNGILHSHYR